MLLSESGSKESTGEEQPKTYRPLVKHFSPGDENYGFDLAKVKMETSEESVQRRQLLLAPTRWIAFEFGGIFGGGL